MLTKAFRIKQETKRVAATFIDPVKSREYLKMMVEVQHGAEEAAKRSQKSKVADVVQEDTQASAATT